MNPRTLLRLYPRPWRERYGEEFVALLEQEPMGFRLLADVLAGAFDAWVSGVPAGRYEARAPVGPQILWVRRQQRRTRGERRIQSAVLGVGVLAAILIVAMTDLSPAASPIRRALLESAFQASPALAVIPFWFAGYSLRTKIAALGWTALVTFVIVFAFNAVFA